MPDLSYTVTGNLRERVVNQVQGDAEVIPINWLTVEWIFCRLCITAEPECQQEWYREGEQPVVS
ncbi:hypothetical protein [Paenibacillus camerounensis]|uniref:hypothetical protein n=1 Tax=Paenibacillus camerounensis TaxID=1243663 RepID=UPI0012FCD583|nr:hypothetical protein [Paenibacillus camerounensis]